VSRAGRGKTAGRGTKGSDARHTEPENFGGQMPLHMRLPRLRGFRNPFREEYQVVNLARLGQLFPDGGAVGMADLVAAGAVCPDRNVKILGSGDVSVPLQVTAHAFSTSAKRRSPELAVAPPSSDRVWVAFSGGYGLLCSAPRTRSGIGLGTRPCATPELGDPASGRLANPTTRCDSAPHGPE
jgi:large subunit ribosomal protein L15